MILFLYYLGAVLVWVMVLFTALNTHRQAVRARKRYEEAEATVEEAAKLFRLIQWMASAVRARDEENAN